MSKPPRRRTRLSGTERRDQIMRTATELFSRYGFRGVTVRELAQKAGISEAMIYHHFPSKEALYDAMLQDKVQRTKHLFYPTDAASAGQDRAVIETIVGNFLREQAKDNSFMRMMLFSALEGHELTRKVVEGPMRDFFQFLGSYLEERMEEGGMKSMNGQVAARILIGMAYYLTLLREIYQDPAVRELNLEDLKENIVDVFCSGITRVATESTHAVKK